MGRSRGPTAVPMADFLHSRKPLNRRRKWPVASPDGRLFRYLNDLAENDRRVGASAVNPARNQQEARRDQAGPACSGWRLDRFLGEQGFRSEEHTSALQSLMRISSSVFCL